MYYVVSTFSTYNVDCTKSMMYKVEGTYTWVTPFKLKKLAVLEKKHLDAVSRAFKVDLLTKKEYEAI